MLPPLEPYARALRAYHDGDHDATVMLHSSLGEYDTMEMAWFFRGPDELFPFDEAALDICTGHVLDAGAGTGVHALVLQERGLQVTAVECLPTAVEIMKARGVEDAREGDMFAMGDEQFDTVLMMMNGIGPVGTLKGFDEFLDRAGSLLRPNGQILVDSGQAETQDPPAEAPTPAWPTEKPNYPGEAWIQLAFEGEWGEPFRELYIDAATMQRRCERKGWACQLVFQDDDTGYVARLQQPR